MVSNDPFISDEIGENAATWETAGPVSRVIFIMVITERSMELTPRLLSSYAFRSSSRKDDVTFLYISNERVRNDYICHDYDTPYESHFQGADRKPESLFT